jgi:hypothetical protein
MATPSASSRRSHRAASWPTTRHSRHDRHLRQALPRWGASMPGYRKTRPGTPPSPARVCPQHVERRGHAARPPCPCFASSVTGQGRHAASPLVVHQRHWKVHQPRSRRQRSGAIGFRFWPHRAAPVRERPPPACVLAKIEPRGTVTPPGPQHSAGYALQPGRHHSAAQSSTTEAVHGSRALLVRRAMLRQGSAMPGFSSVLVGQRCCESQRFACISQSAGALSPKTRLASPRAGGLACSLPSPPSRAPRPCAGSRPTVASWPRSQPARPVTSALTGAHTDTTGTCARHCRAGARQCPATQTATPVHHPHQPRPLKSLCPKTSLQPAHTPRARTGTHRPHATTHAATPNPMRPSPLLLFMR